MVWKIEIEAPAEKDLAKLDIQDARRILRFLFDRVAHLENPRSIGEALRGSRLGEFWKYRVGDYRIITHIEDSTLTILVAKVGNRKNIYR
jgi:mRNA interferase RelE/StbE